MEFNSFLSEIAGHSVRTLHADAVIPLLDFSAFILDKDMIRACKRLAGAGVRFLRRSEKARLIEIIRRLMLPGRLAV